MRERVVAGRFSVYGWTSESDGGRRSFGRVRRFDGRESSGPELLNVGFERYAGRHARHTGFGLRGNSDAGGVQLFAGVHRVWCGWLSFGSPAAWWPAMRRGGRVGRFLDELDDREVVDVRVHDGRVWWQLWHPKHRWTRGTSWWRHGNLPVVDLVFGKRQVDKIVEMPATVAPVPLPEGVYECLISTDTVVLKRKRWPKVKRLPGFELVAVLSEPGYLPSPGKGGDNDGTFSMSGRLDGRPTIANAIGTVVAHVLADRIRRNAPLDYAERIA